MEAELLGPVRAEYVIALELALGCSGFLAVLFLASILSYVLTIKMEPKEKKQPRPKEVKYDKFGKPQS